MRPVNLIPAEERRGQQAPMRSGPLPYVVIGALVAVLAGVTALVITGNQISDSKAQVASLKQQDAAVKARAKRFAAYTQFRSLSEQRVSTVTSLADSRFDWERVMRELSRVLPGDVWLTSLTGTASPDVTTDSSGSAGGGSSGSSSASLRSSIPGPALELSGCADGQDGVAGFVTALKDIDGVTRVGVQSSALPPKGSGAGGAPSGGGSSDAGTDCRTRGFIAQFQMVVAFDAAPIPSSAAAAPAAPAPAPTDGSTTASSTPTSTSTGG